MNTTPCHKSRRVLELNICKLSVICFGTVLLKLKQLLSSWRKLLFKERVLKYSFLHPALATWIFTCLLVVFPSYALRKGGSPLSIMQVLRIVMEQKRSPDAYPYAMKWHLQINHGPVIKTNYQSMQNCMIKSYLIDKDTLYKFLIPQNLKKTSTLIQVKYPRFCICFSF